MVVVPRRACHDYTTPGWVWMDLMLGWMTEMKRDEGRYDEQQTMLQSHFFVVLFTNLPFTCHHEQFQLSGRRWIITRCEAFQVDAWTLTCV